MKSETAPWITMAFVFASGMLCACGGEWAAVSARSGTVGAQSEDAMLGGSVTSTGVVNLFPSQLTVRKGSASAQSIAVLSTNQLTGTIDDWNTYKELSPVSGSFVGDFAFTVPTTTDIGGSAALRLVGNYRGPSKAEQVWSFRLYDNVAGKWVLVGDNASAVSWVWSMVTFTVPTPYARFMDSNRRITARLSTASGSDSCDVDYLTVLVDASSPTPQPTPTPTLAPTPDPTLTPAPNPSGISLPPAGKVSFDWQIGASSDAAIVSPTGLRVMDVDGFNTDATTVAALKAKGIYTVCYIDAGSWEKDRPDSGQYPDYLKIYYDSAWGEWFLDVTDVFKPNSLLATILRARFKMCKEKGFDALEPDNLQNDENAGGKITLQQQIDFNGWVADEAHAAGLAVFQKNGPDKVLLKDRTGKMMVEKFDAILNEECQAYNECSPLGEYSKRGKLVVDVEYKKSLSLNCALSDQLQMNQLKKDLNLVGGGDSGYLRQACP